MNTKEQHWITKAVQLLKQMEFCGTNSDYGNCDDNWRKPYVDEHVCPICGCSGHHSDSCELQKLLYNGMRITNNGVGIAKMICRDLGITWDDNATQPTISGKPIDFTKIFGEAKGIK